MESADHPSLAVTYWALTSETFCLGSHLYPEQRELLLDGRQFQ